MDGMGHAAIDLDHLKTAIPILSLAKSLGLEVRGKQARCYNSAVHKHNDRNFSLGLDTKRNRYKCFACGESGSVIDLYMAIRCVDLKTAISELACGAGLTTYTTRIKAASTPIRATREGGSERDDIGDYSKIYEAFYCYCIGLDKESETYLKGRGLTDETIDRFLVFSVKDYEATDKYLKSEFSLSELRSAGILSEQGSLIFHRHKIIIPFLEGGRIVFLQGRKLDEEHPKYLHLRGRAVPLFNRETLNEAEKGQKVYIAEGVFDAMMLEQNGYRAVGILGVNSFKAEYVDEFRGFEVVLSLDNDEAGERASKEIAKMFYLKGQRVQRKHLPDGIKDITEYFLQKDGGR